MRVDGNFSNVSVDPDPSQGCARGDEAYTEMIIRSGMEERVHTFFCIEPGDASELMPYFKKKIEAEKQSFPLSPSEENYLTLVHKVYDIYRKEVVEKACIEVDNDPQGWTFKNREEWKAKRPTFQDFMWLFARMVYSGAARLAIAEVMKEEFPSLPSNFLPSLYYRHEKGSRYLNY